MADAARVGDLTAGTVAPHVTGVILPPAATTVLAGVRPRARVTDMVKCVCPAPDFIITGSVSVLVQGLPAARVGSKTMHGMTVKTGDASIDVGGEWVGATFGNFPATSAVFQAMAAGRVPPKGVTYPNGVQIPSHTITQSYNNCGVESSREIIHRATGSNVTQEQLLDQALKNNWAYIDPLDPNNLYKKGGSWASGRVPLLAANGVPATTQTPDIKTIEQAIAEKKGVQADVWAAKIWPPNVVAASGELPGSDKLPHAILVTGVKYDSQGQLETVFINDTGIGHVNQPIPAATFVGAMINYKPPKQPSQLLVTDRPIW